MLRTVTTELKRAGDVTSSSDAHSARVGAVVDPLLGLFLAEGQAITGTAADPDGADMMDIWRPRASALRHHVRFGEFISAVGLDVFWNEIGWPPQCRSEGEQIYCD